MKKRRLTFLFICAALSLAFTSKAVSTKISEGNTLLEQGKLPEAMAKYSDAQLEAPLQSEIFFNMGNVLYLEKKYAEAIDSYQKAMEKGDTALEAKAFFNIGNALFGQGQLRAALDAYKQALERDPNDADAKYNIEYTERKMKEMLSQAEQTMQKAMQEQAERKQGEQGEGKKDQGEQQGSAVSKLQETESASATEAQGQEGSGSEEEGKDKAEALQEAEQGKEGEQKESSEPKEGTDEKSGETKQGLRSSTAEGAAGEINQEAAERFLASFEQDQKDILPPKEQQSRKGYADHVSKDW